MGHSVFNKIYLIISVLQFCAARSLYYIFVPVFYTTVRSIEPLR
ncbi:hypothetical protein F0726_02856 [Acidithiobacillus caldus]|nr:hypothetical protein F0726_02240 [Acidithiobacillus caldus]QER45903.1 hypothetical protein F0726_02856 [Acidithiobacillus caldus]